MKVPPDAEAPSGERGRSAHEDDRRQCGSAFISVGGYQADAEQPIWFTEPKKLLDTEGIIVGPKRTSEIATYTSYTEFGGKRVLWYPDRKYYLLGKHLTDEILQ